MSVSVTVQGVFSLKPGVTPAQSCALGVTVTLRPLFEATLALYVIFHGIVGRSGVSTVQPALHVWGKPVGGGKPPVPCAVIGTV